MPNVKGTNQYGKKKYPPENVFKEILQGYTRQGLTYSEQVNLLEKELGLKIAERTLSSHRKRLNIASVRKQDKTPEERAQAVLDIKKSDASGRWGVVSTKNRLASQGVFISKNELRNVLHDHFDHEFDKRFLPYKTRIPPPILSGLAPWNETHFYKHEKIGAQTLTMSEGGPNITVAGGDVKHIVKHK